MTGRRYAVIGILGAAPLIFFHEVCLQGRMFLLRDLFNWFYPWRTFAAGSLARGEFPLWNPYSYSGTPFLANMQSGLLYPPNVVFWLFDFPVAMRLFVVAQFAMAAGFTYLLLRALSCRVTSSLTGAIAYAYSGWMLVHIEFPNKLAAAAWLPLVILGILHCHRGRMRRGVLIGGLATACCITAGYPQTAYTVGLGAAVIWALLAVRAVLPDVRRREPGRVVRTLAALPAIGALGFLLAAAQILPFMEAVSLSTRAEPVGTVLARGLAPAHYAALVYPHLFGLPGYLRYWGGDLYQFWLGHLYVGLATLPLAVAAIRSLFGRDVDDETARRRWWAGAALTLCVLSVILCLGDRTPLGPLFVGWLPGFSFIKWISTMSVLLAFSLAWLAAQGLDALLESLESRRHSLAGTVAATIGTILLVLGAAIAAFAPERFGALVRLAVSSVILPAQEPFLTANMDVVRTDAVLAGLCSLLLMGGWFAARVGLLPPSRFAALVPLVLFVDLKAAATGINHVTSPAIYREVPEVVDRLKSEADPLSRIYVPETTLSEDRRMYGSEEDVLFRWAANTQLFNLNLPHGIFSASDGDPMQTRRTARYRRALESAPGNEEKRRLLAADSIGVVLQVAPGMKTELTGVPGRHPRAYLTGGARRMPAREALRTMRDTVWDPFVEALVEEDFPGTPRPPDGLPVRQTIHAIVYRNNSVTIDAETTKPSYLVLTDTIYPGWRATVGGTPTPIFTANYLFRGIDLPPGRHEVIFRYQPRSVLWGGVGSLAGLGVACLLAFGGRFGRASGGAAAGPEQSEDGHEERRAHHRVDRGKGPARDRDVQRQTRQADPAGDPSPQGRSDEPQSDRAEAADAVRPSRQTGAEGSAKGGHCQNEQPEQHPSSLPAS